MWIVIILVVLGIIAVKFFYDIDKQKQHVAKQGGMQHKYRELIEYIKDADSRTKIYNDTGDRVTLGISNLGGTTLFTITQTFGRVTVQWKVDSPSFGKHSLEWEFDEFLDQKKMILKINNDLTKYQSNVMTSLGQGEIEEKQEAVGDKSSDILETIEFLAKQGVKNIETDYKVSSNEGRFELFMFNMFLGWMFFLERNKIDTSSDIGNQKFLILYRYSLEQGIQWEISEMINLYRERYNAYKRDLKGLQNSHYPETKQYLPAYTFAAIYYDALRINPDLSWTDFDNETAFNVEKYHQLSDFAGVMIKQINWMFNKLK